MKTKEELLASLPDDVRKSLRDYARHKLEHPEEIQEQAEQCAIGLEALRKILGYKCN